MNLGKMGEAIATRMMLHKGYEIVEQNLHAPGGEIDLIFKEPDEEAYILVEVKTRKNDAFGDIRTSITKSKREKMLKAAEWYFLTKLSCAEMPYIRLDAILLKFKDGKMMCEHLENLGLKD